MAGTRKQAEKEQSPAEALLTLCQKEAEETSRQLQEINLMVEQSRLEINKLASRNAAINSQLQQIQAQFDSVPRGDIRAAYDAALDAQQRLFVMRGQLDKLQSDQEHLEHFLAVLQQVIESLRAGALAGSSGISSASEMIEMVIRAQEAERHRLSNQMHDGPAQALANFILQTEIATRLFDIDQARAREELNNLKTAASTTLQKVREFIFQLKPMMLDDLGLGPTIQRYVEDVKGQSNLDIRLTTSGMDIRLDQYVEVMIFRAIQELLGNVVKHSQATQVKLDLNAASGEVRVSVDDNGKGFDTDSLEMTSGMGLKVIRDRVNMLGGEMEIDSVPGQGTRIVFAIPAQVIGRT